MDAAQALTEGRSAFEQRSWSLARECLSTADLSAPLDGEDLTKLAQAGYLVGQDDESADAWARSSQWFANAGDAPRAARCAFWAAFQLFNAGEDARGGGWLAQSISILDDYNGECVERGYITASMGIQQTAMGDFESARQSFTDSTEAAVRFSDPDLLAMSQLGMGHVHLLTGQDAAGGACFDEVMVAATTDRLSTVVTGLVYCATIMACQEMYDVQRATEWTRALSRWCEEQPDLVPFRGQCLVHRSQLMQLHGDWADAMREVGVARTRLEEPGRQPAVGLAYYQQGELHRVRGEFTQAETAYQAANQHGHRPQPGLAMLWLAQGRVDAAATAVGQALDEAHERLARARLLPACVEISLAAGAVERASGEAEQLAAIATDLDTPLMRATSASALGAVELQSGATGAGLTTLMRAWGLWQAIEAPYEAARTRVLIGRARESLGDLDSARMEFDAAQWVFQQLGAAHDLAELQRLTHARTGPSNAALTARELEVLRLLSTGATNRAIALELVISEKTVARHVSNIFTKLDVSSRSAATAYAYQHHLA